MWDKFSFVNTEKESSSPLQVWKKCYKIKICWSCLIKQEELSVLLSTGNLSQKCSCCRLYLTGLKTSSPAITSFHFPLQLCKKLLNTNLGRTCLFIPAIVCCQQCSFHHDWWARYCIQSSDFTHFGYHSDLKVFLCGSFKLSIMCWKDSITNTFLWLFNF